MDKFREVIRQVIDNQDTKKYPKGMNASEVFAELRAKEQEIGIDLSLTTVLDVVRELRNIYGPISGFQA